MASVLIGAAIGLVLSAAVSVPQAIITSAQAQTNANYQKAVYTAYAQQQDIEAQAEADEIARQAKFTFATQRAIAAASGTDAVTSSAGDIQYMSAGMAALDVEKKLYEGDLALWEGRVKSQMAQYEADVAKYNAWSSAAINIAIGGVTGAAAGGLGMAAAGAGKAASSAGSTGAAVAGAAKSAGASSGFISMLRTSTGNVMRGYKMLNSLKVGI